MPDQEPSGDEGWCGRVPEHEEHDYTLIAKDETKRCGG